MPDSSNRSRTRDLQIQTPSFPISRNVIIIARDNHNSKPKYVSNEVERDALKSCRDARFISGSLLPFNCIFTPPKLSSLPFPLSLLLFLYFFGSQGLTVPPGRLALTTTESTYLENSSGEKYWFCLTG